MKQLAMPAMLGLALLVVSDETVTANNRPSPVTVENGSSNGSAVNDKTHEKARLAALARCNRKADRTPMEALNCAGFEFSHVSFTDDTSNLSAAAEQGLRQECGQDDGSDIMLEWSCPQVDADRVAHFYYGTDTPGDASSLVEKWIYVRDIGERSIRAFGIGIARDRATVMAALRRAMPSARWNCGEDYDFPTGSAVACEMAAGDGRLIVTFSADKQLIELGVKMDNYF